jgi:hypothetical protein
MYTVRGLPRPKILARDALLAGLRVALLLV